MASSDRVTRLTNIRDNLEKVLEDETAYQLANGPKPTYQAQGRNVQWGEWLDIMQRQVEFYNKLIQAANGAWEEGVRGVT